MTSLIILLFCIATGDHCLYEPAANVTVYAPELGAHNCMEPCDLAAYLEPLQYGVGAACGPSIPYGTQAYIDGGGWRTCNDRGGAIDDDEIDVLIRAEEWPWALWMSGRRGVVWVMP